MSQYHITIQEGSQLPPVHRCSQCCVFYHCPLCSPHIYKPAHRYKVHRHLKCHLSRAVHFKGYSVYKCNLGCRPQAHFHCFCEKLFLNRNQFLHHLSTKHELLPTTHQSACSGVKAGDGAGDGDAEQMLPLSPASEEQPHDHPSPTRASINDILCSCIANYAAWTSGTFTNIVAPPVSERPALNNELTSAHSHESCQSKTGPKKLATCPQCSRNKICLNMHMKLKPSSSTAAGDTSASPLSDHINRTSDSPPAVGGTECHLNPTSAELEILTQLRVLQQQQNQILQLLLKLTNTHGTDVYIAPDLRAMFPIADEEGLATLELKLRETPDLKDWLISFFGDNDGLPIDQTVQRILERMLSNAFAKRMDWKGKSNKVSFVSSCLKEIVSNAVRKNSVCARAADEAVGSAVKKWLQQSAERDEGAERGGESRPEVDMVCSKTDEGT